MLGRAGRVCVVKRVVAASWAGGVQVGKAFALGDVSLDVPLLTFKSSYVKPGNEPSVMPTDTFLNSTAKCPKARGNGKGKSRGNRPVFVGVGLVSSPVRLVS